MRYDYTEESAAAASSFSEGIFMLISSKGVGIQALDAALLSCFKCMQTEWAKGRLNNAPCTPGFMVDSELCQGLLVI